MKDANKSSIKKAKKNKSQELEKDLSEKLNIFFSSLGHDVEDIGVELKKASKLFAKKFSKKLKKVKSVVGDQLHFANAQVEEGIASAKNEVSKDSLVIKKGIQKIAKEAKSSISQKVAVVKKAVVVKPKSTVATAKITSPQKTISKTAVKPTAVKPTTSTAKKTAESAPVTKTKTAPSKSKPKGTL